MRLTDLSSRDLSAFIALHHKRNQLKADLEAVFAKLESFGSRRGNSAVTKRKKRTRRNKRRSLGEGILPLLKAADSKGVHIDAIAKKLKRDKASVSAWFYGTGKKQAKKVAPATYAAA
ncbi:hypothetical protein SAMN05444156_0610 [Verrucomicrobium sp. GAS474]|uniref:hypothetical protein n=1 Tax=Verrucomicrobium sp. GAS474 TaxID=1882831 RepID=UPI00087D1B6C|nr:hypothetical protein [Verrucomicrobium sp. GAS474]SDT90542.1 hypothetical protein SAMN05444156_0610 [Verrucomicrobium sp. GAS474]